MTSRTNSCFASTGSASNSASNLAVAVLMQGIYLRDADCQARQDGVKARSHPRRVGQRGIRFTALAGAAQFVVMPLMLRVECAGAVCHPPSSDFGAASPLSQR